MGHGKTIPGFDQRKPFSFHQLSPRSTLYKQTSTKYTNGPANRRRKTAEKKTTWQHSRDDHNGSTTTNYDYYFDTREKDGKQSHAGFYPGEFRTVITQWG